jgi:hypothetical protein
MTRPSPVPLRVAVLLGLALLLPAIQERGLPSQVDEAALAEAFDRLGLGPVSPEELKDRVAALSGLSFERDVPVDFMSREDLARYIHALFDEEYPEAYAEREATMLRGFGFLQPGQDLRAVRERVLNENIAGFYDERPGVKKLFAISSGRTLDVLNQLILSHELRHALQDQHFVIRDKLEVESDFDDRRLAPLSFLEGDASVLMVQYLASGVGDKNPTVVNLLRAYSQSLSGAEIAEMFAGPALREAPAVVQEQLVAPYFQGQKFAARIFDAGGFALLNDKLAHPPRSMEQVLHPEKYLGTPDEPVDVPLPEVSGQSPVFEGTLGEFFIRVLLEGGGERDDADADAETAAAGWGGDHYAVLAVPGGVNRLVWRTSWDTEADAAEFAAALRGYSRARFSGEDIRISAAGKTVRFERPSFR